MKKNAVNGVNLVAGTQFSPNAVVNNLNVATAPLLTAVTPTFTLGNYHKIEQAKQACERHYAAGCDLRRAEKISR